jgi:hypothetical protein
MYDDKEFGAEAVFFGKTVEKLKTPYRVWLFPDADGDFTELIVAKNYTGLSIEQIAEFERGATEVDNALPFSTSLQTKSLPEASPFRFVLVNGQGANETGPFESGFKGNLLWGWVPGLKMLNMIIYDETLFLTGKIFLRLVSNVEFAFVFGSTDFEYAYGNVFQI